MLIICVLLYNCCGFGRFVSCEEVYLHARFFSSSLLRFVSLSLSGGFCFCCISFFIPPPASFVLLVPENSKNCVKTKLPSTYSIGYSPDCCQFLTMTWLYRSWHIFSLDEHPKRRRGRKPSLLSKALHLRACRNCTCTYLCITLEAEGAMTRQGNSN